jgi:hypothetical protein
MWGTWGMNSGAYINLALKCKEIINQFKNTRGQWVRRENNETADSLSKAALGAVGIKSRKWK